MTLNRESLVAEIEAAEDTKTLEALGKQHLGVNVDRRKSVETLREQLLELAETEQPTADTPAPEPESGNDGEPEQEQKQKPEQESAPADAPPASELNRADEMPTETAPLSPSKPSKPKRPRAGGETRLLRHKGNGRIFTWNAALADRDDMEEVGREA